MLAFKLLLDASVMFVSPSCFGCILSNRTEEQSQLQIMEREEIEDDQLFEAIDKQKISSSHHKWKPRAVDELLGGGIETSAIIEKLLGNSGDYTIFH
ncbi:DNA repair family protein [Perilla frutescens var. frutescens]|nr:DNA repair family protein [Perilla frutescens var. frutescens]